MKKDLFEHYYLLNSEVNEIITEYKERFESNSYSGDDLINKLRADLKPFNLIFDLNLDYEPCNLRYTENHYNKPSIVTDLFYHNFIDCDTKISVDSFYNISIRRDRLTLMGDYSTSLLNSILCSFDVVCSVKSEDRWLEIKVQELPIYITLTDYEES
jgi:hypothetical protein